MKRIFWVVVLAVLLLVTACGKQETSAPAQGTEKTETTQTKEQNKTENKTTKEDTGVKEFTSSYTNGEKPIATISIRDFGDIVVELDPVNAPQTVENFVTLSKEGFYNGLTFHRIYQHFMIQGGDPDGNGFGGPGYSIFGEFSNNGWDNKLSHVRGTISMARSGMPNSAGSQFFICDSDDDTFLDGQYAAFGTVIEGLDVLDAVAAVEVEAGAGGEVSSPVKPVYIDTITIKD